MLATYDARSTAAHMFFIWLSYSSEMDSGAFISLKCVKDAVLTPSFLTIVNELKVRIEKTSHCSEMGYRMDVSRVMKGRDIGQLLRTQTKL
ncbi:hypothetical protein AVEN_208632-1 [Araneus ventricosus]|uniref:Uncharacterized protein n=1 Tax=Araneus ventricosus TaxID=182803 RepID=A0A4Y2GN74_ARAVE|nr:hypothetical protein AVEN_208632-1 [Araneus ventricosus]